MLAISAEPLVGDAVCIGLVFAMLAITFEGLVSAALLFRLLVDLPQNEVCIK